MLLRIILIPTLSWVAIASCFAQPPPKVRWTGTVFPSDARVGESAQLRLTAETGKGWHVYGFRLGQPEGPVWTAISLEEGSAAKANGEPLQPEPLRRLDRGFKFDVQYHEGATTFAIPVVIVGYGGIKARALYQACNDQSCDPPTTAIIEVPFSPSAGEPRSDHLAALAEIPPQPSGHITAGSTPAEPQAGTTAVVTDDQAQAIKQAQESGLFAYLWLSFTAGLLALLTPCVWPMVPITVSFFSKKGEGESSNVKGALAYCLGILGTFTGLGVVMTLLFGSTGIQQLAANPWVNIFLAGLFIVLALNLFGVFEIIIPSSIVNRAQKGTGKSGLIGPLLMGLTFSLTTFTCTVPFVGTLLVAATQGSWTYPVLGMLAFSLAFALPFFFLALFPQYLAKVPKSGGWLMAVKATMGFLELAAALKFLSSADLVWQMGYLTKAVFLAIWAGIFALCGLYLIGGVLLPTSPEKPKIGIMRRVFGLGMVATAIYWLAAINGAPLGQFAGFPPPDPYPGRSGQTGAIAWSHTIESAIPIAREQGKALFVNFTGVTCTNCRYMEQDVFPQPDIARGINEFVAVELYTDRGTKDDNANAALREKLTNSVTNPVYVVVTPDMEVLKVFQGSSVTTAQFASFLAEAKTVSDQWESRQARR